MYLQAHSPRTSSVATIRYSIARGESGSKRLAWGFVSEGACFSSNQLKPSKKIVLLRDDERHANSSVQVFKWRDIFSGAWRWQRVLDLVSASGWIRDYAAATVTVLVVQAITAQDISHALSSTSPILLESRSMDHHLTVSKSGSIRRFPASFRCGGKNFTGGKTNELLRMRAGASITRQVRGIEGLVAGGNGGQRRASSTALKASPSLALITSSLTSPLAAIVNAGSHVDLNVLRASFASSLNLISLCSFVVWMQRSGQLSAETPVVLSQVAFRVLIPCLLMTKVAATLASHPTASLLFLPLVAIAQVLVGALLGKAACRLVYGKSSAISLPTFGSSMSASSGSAPPITAFEKESGVITQVEKPLSTISLPRYSKQYMTAKKEAIITAACAFGNSFTLPLIFMTGVLGAEESSKIAGYLALFMVGWSLSLWTVGYSIIATGDEDSDLRESSPKEIFSWTTLQEGFKRIMNPPLFGVMIGVLIGGTPLSHFFLPVANGATISVQSTGALAVLRTSTAGILKPVFDAAALLGTATLAVQTIVLASSLAASLPPRETVRDAERSSSSSMKAVINPLEANAGSYSPELDSVLDTRAFWIISSVRLVAMPVIAIISTVILKGSVLPIDPVYNLLVLAESAMPSAQNLVLLSQLRATTRRLSGVLAGLLLHQYVLSIIPITFWMALFLAIAKPA